MTVTTPLCVRGVSNSSSRGAPGADGPAPSLSAVQGATSSEPHSGRPTALSKGIGAPATGHARGHEHGGRRGALRPRLTPRSALAPRWSPRPWLPGDVGSHHRPGTMTTSPAGPHGAPARPHRQAGRLGLPAVSVPRALHADLVRGDRSDAARPLALPAAAPGGTPGGPASPAPAHRPRCSATPEVRGSQHPAGPMSVSGRWEGGPSEDRGGQAVPPRATAVPGSDNWGPSRCIPSPTAAWRGEHRCGSQHESQGLGCSPTPPGAHGSPRPRQPGQHLCNCPGRCARPSEGLNQLLKGASPRTTCPHPGHPPGRQQRVCGRSARGPQPAPSRRQQLLEDGFRISEADRTPGGKLASVRAVS